MKIYLDHFIAISFENKTQSIGKKIQRKLFNWTGASQQIHTKTNQKTCQNFTNIEERVKKNASIICESGLKTILKIFFPNTKQRPSSLFEDVNTDDKNIFLDHKNLGFIKRRTFFSCKTVANAERLKESFRSFRQSAMEKQPCKNEKVPFLINER